MLATENFKIELPPAEQMPGQEGVVKRLGKAPAKSHPNMVMFADIKKKAAIDLPTATNFWTGRKPFPLRTWGNTLYGCCTRAKQALAQTRLERLEQRRTINITDEEVIRVYTDMSNRLYGGGDNGAYELDALKEWRNKDLTFRDEKGHPYTIDAFTALNHRNLQEVKEGLFVSGAHGIAVCFNLPMAWQSTYEWTVPEGQQLTDMFTPGSWGGHSMWGVEFDDDKVIGDNKGAIALGHTWGVPDGWISYKAFSIYCDEAYVVVDSINEWKKRTTQLNLDKLKSYVNSVSDVKIK